MYRRQEQEQEQQQEQQQRMWLWLFTNFEIPWPSHMHLISSRREPLQRLLANFWKTFTKPFTKPVVVGWKQGSKGLGDKRWSPEHWQSSGAFTRRWSKSYLTKARYESTKTPLGEAKAHICGHVAQTTAGMPENRKGNPTFFSHTPRHLAPERSPQQRGRRTAIYWDEIWWKGLQHVVEPWNYASVLETPSLQWVSCVVCPGCWARADLWRCSPAGCLSKSWRTMVRSS